MTPTERYPFLAARLFGTPLLADERKAVIVAEVLLGRCGLTAHLPAQIEDDPRMRAARRGAGGRALGPIDEAAMRERAGHGGYLLDHGSGIARIAIEGTLVHRSHCLGSFSGELGYDGIGAQLDAALADPMVRGILFDVHSPGGEGHGCFGLADRIAAARGKKPLVALVDEMAFSAAYALAAACDEVWLAGDTAEAGSIGAVSLHWDFSGHLEQEGVVVTVLTAGARKADGNPFEALPKDVAERELASLERMRQLFARRVADWRGLSLETVLATEADRFDAEEATGLGLADGIIAPAELHQRFAEVLASPPQATVPAA